MIKFPGTLLVFAETAFCWQVLYNDRTLVRLLHRNRHLDIPDK